MRILHSLTDVSNNDEQSFLKLCDDTRRNALIYTEVLQPRSEEVVKTIKAYIHEFRTFDYEEWKLNLEEITQEVNTAEKSCHLLLQLHESLTVSLKKNEDDAVLALRGLNNLRKSQETERQKLLDNAAESLKIKEWYDRLAMILIVPTIGIGTAIYKKKSAWKQLEVDEILQKAEASDKYEAATQEQADLTENCLVPAILQFQAGLSACSDFLKVTKETLDEMSSQGEKGQNNKAKRYFRLMQKHAEDLYIDCSCFLTSSSHIKTDMKAIPNKSSDKAYVRGWLTDQLAQLDDSLLNKKFLKQISIL